MSAPARPAVVPPVSLSWFPAGVAISAQPGDLLGVETADWEGRLIRFGEGLRGRRSTWNHFAVVVTGGDVAEATARGVVRTPLDRYTARLAVVVHPTAAAPEQVRAAVDFAEWSVGIRYAWAALPVFAADCVTGWSLGFSAGQRMVCSTHACRAAERWGLEPDKSPYAVMPSVLGGYFGANEVPPGVLRAA